MSEEKLKPCEHKDYEEKFIVINKKHLEYMHSDVLKNLTDILFALGQHNPKINNNKYLVVNQDEPYANKVMDLIVGKSPDVVGALEQIESSERFLSRFKDTDLLTAMCLKKEIELIKKLLEGKEGDT